MSSKDFFEALIIFEKTSVVWFLGLIERFLIIQQKKFCMVLRTAFQVSKGLFWGNNWFKKQHFYLFFWTLSGKLIKICRTFFRRSVKNTISACRLAFGGKDNFWVNSWQFWHKLLAWVSILLSTWPEEPFDKKMLQSFYNLLLFSEQKTYQIFGQVFSAGLPNMQTPCQASFSLVKISFEKFSCFIIVSRVWAEVFRVLSNFLAEFSKLHSARAEDRFKEKLCFFQKGFFHACFRILSHKKWILRNNSACS